MLSTHIVEQIDGFWHNSEISLQFSRKCNKILYYMLLDHIRKQLSSITPVKPLKFTSSGTILKFVHFLIVNDARYLLYVVNQSSYVGITHTSIYAQ